MGNETASRTRILHTEALCLRVIPFSQTSRIVTWLTPRHGLLSTLIKGCCRPKSPFLGHYDLYYTCELLYYARDRNGLHIARECAVLNSRDPLRSNWRAASVASYLADLAVRCHPPGPDAQAAYRSHTAALDALCDGSPPLNVLLQAETGLLETLGLSPRLNPCLICEAHGQPQNYRFSMGSGRLVCPHAPAPTAGPDDSVALSENLMRALRARQRAWRTGGPEGDARHTAVADDERPPSSHNRVQEGTPERLYGCESAPDTNLALCRFLGLFLRYHLDLPPAPRKEALTMIFFDRDRFLALRSPDA